MQKTGKKLKQIKSYDPDHYIYVEIMDSWDQQQRSHLLLSKKESFELIGLKANLSFSQLGTPNRDFVDGVKRYLNRLVGKIKQVLSITIASMTTRSLDLGGDDEEDFTAVKSVVNEDFAKKVGDDISVDVINTFASMGERELDL